MQIMILFPDSSTGNGRAQPQSKETKDWIGKSTIDTVVIVNNKTEDENTRYLRSGREKGAL